MVDFCNKQESLRKAFDQNKLSGIFAVFNILHSVVLSAAGGMFSCLPIARHTSAPMISLLLLQTVARQEPKEKLGQVKSRDKKNSLKVCTDTTSFGRPLL